MKGPWREAQPIGSDALGGEAPGRPGRPMIEFFKEGFGGISCTVCGKGCVPGESCWRRGPFEGGHAECLPPEHRNPWSITFVVEGPPVAKGRARITTRGGQPRAYTPSKTVAYETRVRAWAAANMFGHPPVTGPLRVQIDAVFPLLKSGPKAERGAPPTSRPDADNVAKAVLDAINGVVYVDDAQVVDLRVVKRRGPEPCVRVLVAEFRGVDA